jgi:replication fork protection complex subunit Tof1/Swi1
MIKDVPASTHASADNVEKSSLQSTLIDQLQSSDFLPLLVTLASSSNSREFNQYNVLVLDIVHLLWRGVSPVELGKDQTVAVRDKLSSLLEKEDLTKTAGSRNTSSRHSRFGATVAVQAGGGRRVVLSKGGAVKGDVGTVMDLSKKRGRIDIHSVKMLDPDAKVDLQPNAARTLKSFTEEFIRTAFNSAC